MAPTGIAETLTQVALDAQAAPDLDRTLARIVTAAAEAIPGVQYASVSLLEKQKIRTVARTAAIAEQVDQLQYKAGQGPCLDAIEAAHPFRTGNLAADTRWPDFGSAAAEAGVVSMMAFQLRGAAPPGRPVGALNLFSGSGDANADAEHIGGLFAAHATIALLGELDRAGLRAALGTRDAIGTAKGILMHQHTLTEDAACAMLVAASQRSNVKLHDVVHWIITDANDQADGHRKQS